MIHRLILLLAGHALCDYPLQGDFLAKGKNAFNPLPGVPWYQCLMAHAAIHAGMVYLVTGNIEATWLEFALHCLIDHMKCKGWFGFNVDQVLHVICKIAWSLA